MTVNIHLHKTNKPLLELPDHRSDLDLPSPTTSPRKPDVCSDCENLQREFGDAPQLPRQIDCKNKQPKILKTNLLSKRMQCIESPLLLLACAKPVEHEVRIDKWVLLPAINNVIYAKNGMHVVRFGVHLSIDRLSHRSLANDVQRTQADWLSNIRNFDTIKCFD